MSADPPLSPQDLKIHAMRIKRIDDEEAAALKYGTRYLLMQLSALSPSTRRSHAERHGKLYTFQEVRDWYASGSNIIGCKCSFVSVLVDAQGNPVVPGIVERARQIYLKTKSTTEYEWTKDRS